MLAGEIDGDAAFRTAWQKGFVVLGVSLGGLADEDRLDDDGALLMA